ncbi:MAG: family 1 glycosylhydrolase [Pseudomonadota bacterium]|nr:family 1 glycosylhydrolase [Pseudomonadota bacterium]MEC8516393.1 family 1 glycosylhydrolase [Pseudomonadota bacterium]
MVKAAGEVHDLERDAYFEGYIAALASLIDEDISLKGYFPWSLLDKYEWAFG